MYSLAYIKTLFLFRAAFVKEKRYYEIVGRVSSKQIPRMSPGLPKNLSQDVMKYLLFRASSVATSV